MITAQDRLMSDAMKARRIIEEAADRPFITDKLPRDFDPVPRVEYINGNGILCQTPAMCVLPGQPWRVTENWLRKQNNLGGQKS